MILLVTETAEGEIRALGDLQSSYNRTARSDTLLQSARDKPKLLTVINLLSLVG
jgi:hypothetical protein